MESCCSIDQGWPTANSSNVRSEDRPISPGRSRSSLRFAVLVLPSDARLSDLDQLLLDKTLHNGGDTSRSCKHEEVAAIYDH